MKRTIIWALALFLTGWSGLNAQEVGNEAPDFEVNLEGGGTFKLSDYQGKVVFVFLFGNGCPSCKAIGSDVETMIHQPYMDTSRFAAIGLDTWDASSSESSVSGFRSSTGITFPLAIKAGSVAADYGTTYDRFMVIDREGILVHKGLVLASNDINNAKEAISQSLAVTSVNSPADQSVLKVYPNPAGRFIYLESGEEEIQSFHLYDMTGKEVLVLSGIRSGNSSITIPVGEVEPGLYFYQYRGSKSKISGKLIIQH